MGLLDSINTASGQSNGKNYVPPGKHKLLLKSTELKVGTAKNAGKEWAIFSGEFIESSRTDLPSCAPGMPFAIFIETKPDGYDMAANKIKGILLATATEQDLAGVPRANLPADSVQNDPQHNPYLNLANGITWAEYLAMALKHKAIDGAEVYVTATNVDRSAKGKPPVTNYSFQAKGLPPMEIVPAPLAPQQAPAQVPATQGPPVANVPAQQTAPAPQQAAPGTSLFSS